MLPEKIFPFLFHLTDVLIEIFGSPLFSKDFAEQTDAAVGDGLRRRADENSNFRWLEMQFDQ